MGIFLEEILHSLGTLQAHWEKAESLCYPANPRSDEGFHITQGMLEWSQKGFVFTGYWFAL